MTTHRYQRKGSTTTYETLGQAIDGTVQRPTDGSETVQKVSGLSDLAHLATRFPLPWSHYVRLLSIEEPEARAFYEAEAIRRSLYLREKQ